MQEGSEAAKEREGGRHPLSRIRRNADKARTTWPSQHKPASQHMHAKAAHSSFCLRASKPPSPPQSTASDLQSWSAGCFHKCIFHPRAARTSFSSRQESGACGGRELSYFPGSLSLRTTFSYSPLKLIRVIFEVAQNLHAQPKKEHKILSPPFPPLTFPPSLLQPAASPQSEVRTPPISGSRGFHPSRILGGLPQAPSVLLLASSLGNQHVFPPLSSRTPSLRIYLVLRDNVC